MSKTKKTETTKETSNTVTELFSDTNITMKSGHLTKDPEIVGDGKYVKIRIASNKQYQTADGEIKTNTNYFNALVSSNLKEAFPVAENLKKGDWVYLKGEDSTKSVDTAEGYKQTASTIFPYKVTLKKAKAQSEDKAEATPMPA